MTDKEQAALETEPEATQSGQVEEAQEDDLDALLAEHDQGTQDTAPQPAPSSNKIDEIYRFMQQQEQKNVHQETQKAISGAIKSIKEMVGSDDVDDDLVDTILQGRASKDERIARAFQNRSKNPAAWTAALKSVAKEVKRFVPTDDDREAVTAAVRSGSTAKPEPERDFPTEKEIKSMSDRDFNQLWKGVK